MDAKHIIVLDFLLDDHFALWDFADSFPDHRPDALNSAVENLIDLVRQGYVTVTFGKWIENDTASVSTKSAELALRDPSAWHPTGREPGYIVELTDKGRCLLRERGIGPSAR
jgi:hypothetical protein